MKNRGKLGWIASIVLVITLILYSLSRIGLFSIAPVYKLESKNLEEGKITIDLDNFRNRDYHCLAFKFRKISTFYFIIELIDAETGVLIEGREMVSMRKEEDTLQRKYVTSYFGNIDAGEVGEIVDLRGADIPNDVKKLEIKLIPIIADGSIELGFKTFRWCNN